MAPIVHDGLLKTASGKNACLGAEGCSCIAPSMRPSGHASLAPTNASKGHVIVAPGLSPKGSESLGPSLALGNSKSRGVKGSSSVRRRTPEGQEFLSLSIAPQSQSPVLHSVKDHGGVAAPVHAPGHVNSPPLSTECCDSLALSIASKGHDPTTSSSNKEPKCHRAPTTHTVSESQHSQVPSAATKGHTAPTPITGEPKNQSAQFEKRNKSPGPILEPGSNIAQAADILIALSTPREKGN